MGPEPLKDERTAQRPAAREDDDWTDDDRDEGRERCADDSNPDDIGGRSTREEPRRDDAPSKRNERPRG